MNTDQIVSESEWTMESVGDFHLLLNEHQREEIAKHHNAAIKSAIEKATVDTYRTGYEHGLADRVTPATVETSRVAHKCSLPEGWTHEEVQDYIEAQSAHASDEEQQEGHPQEYGDS